MQIRLLAAIARRLLFLLLLAAAAPLLADDAPPADKPAAKSPEKPVAKAAVPAVIELKGAEIRFVISGTAAVEDDRAAAREAAILKALNQTVVLDFEAAPLKDILAEFKKQLHIDFVCDMSDLEQAAIDKSASIHVHDISGRAALDIVLGQMDLDWDAHCEVLWIAARTKILDMTRPKVYDVAKILDSPDDPNDTGNFDDLIQTITSTVSPSKWTEAGGSCSISPFTAGGTKALVINADRRMHESVAALLHQLENLHRGKSAKVSDAAKPNEQTAPDHAGAKAPKPAGAPLKHESGAFRAAPLDANQQSIVESNNQFACDLYTKFGGERRNLIFSPFSVATSLAMVSSGAHGETADQLAAALHCKLPPEQFHPAWIALAQQLLQTDNRDKSRLLWANKMWFDHSVSIKQPFADLLRNQYGVAPASVDFADAKKLSADANCWVAEQTDGMIPEILNPEDVPRSRAFLVCGVVYFNGKWTTVFEKKSTHPGKFDAFGVAMQVPLMFSEEDSRYGYVDGVQVVEKPYDGCSLAMMIALPPKGERDFAALRASLSAEKIALWSSGLGKRRVRLHLPRFKLDSFANLLEPLKSLGVRTAFDPINADFSGIADEQLCLSRVMHKAVIDVNEEGTKAAAATIVGGRFGGGFAVEPPSPVEFRADHPFVFLIRDTATGAIVFMGQVTSPVKELADATAPTK